MDWSDVDPQGRCLGLIHTHQELWCYGFISACLCYKERSAVGAHWSAAKDLLEIGLCLRHCTGAARQRIRRGDERIQDGMFSYVSLEQRVPMDHPLREVRKLIDVVLGSLNREPDALYRVFGLPRQRWPFALLFVAAARSRR